MNSEHESQGRKRSIGGAALIFGLAIGAGIGTLIDHFAVGISMGICLGIGVAMLLMRK